MNEVLAKFQKSVTGMYDLMDTFDCHAVITFLLKDLEVTKAQDMQSREDIRSLAALVLAGDFGAKEKAHKVLAPSGSKNSARNAIKFIMKMGETAKFAEGLNNEQLAKEVFDKVWANLDMSSQAAAVLGEMLERFKTKLVAVNVPNQSEVGLDGLYE